MKTTIYSNDYAFITWAMTYINITRKEIFETGKSRPKKRDFVIYTIKRYKIKIIVWGTPEHMRAEIRNDNS